MSQRRTRIFSGLSVLITAAALLLTATPGAVAAGAGRPGTPGLGDYLFPGLGNGGYDAKDYTLKLRYPTAPAQPVQGTVVMDAVAGHDLSSFNLDFAGDAVTAVRVDGRPASFDWQQQAEELVITPSRSLHRGCSFKVEVTFTSHPITPSPDDLYPVGWIATAKGSFTSFQPDAAHRAIPVNDHPSDKATWRFELDVPRGVTAVANGVPAGQRHTSDRTVWSYVERSPLATELIQLATGTDLSVVERKPVAGVAYRDVIAQGPRALFEPAFAHGPAQLEWATNKIGRFPNAIYGNLGVDHRFGYALETQGLSLHSSGLFDPTFIPGRTGEWWFYSTVMVHEIYHEWYGNSVSPARWSDLWLNEGWATWGMKQYEHEMGTIDEWGYPSLEEYMRDQYAQGDIMRHESGPVARPDSAAVLFSATAYDGGALVLYALQQKVGPDKFQRIAREWPQRFRGTSASTDDFIAFASRVSGQDLTGFLRAWLYADRTPAMPGHPDWTVQPMTTAAASAQAQERDGHEQPHRHLDFAVSGAK
jgi:aminopeptidase N